MLITNRTPSVSIIFLNFFFILKTINLFLKKTLIIYDIKQIFIFNFFFKKTWKLNLLNSHCFFKFSNKNTIILHFFKKKIWKLNFLLIFKNVKYNLNYSNNFFKIHILKIFLNTIHKFKIIYLYFFVNNFKFNHMLNFFFFTKKTLSQATKKCLFNFNVKFL